MSQDEERAAMRAAVETGAVSVGEYVAKYGSEPALPNDTRQAELQAALARAERAEAKYADTFQLYVDANEARIDAERQRDEAFTAGAEAMREACAQASEGEAYGFPPEQLTEHGQGYDRACKEIAAILRALPIPAQEGK